MKSGFVFYLHNQKISKIVYKDTDSVMCMLYEIHVCIHNKCMLIPQDIDHQVMLTYCLTEISCKQLS